MPRKERQKFFSHFFFKISGTLKVYAILNNHAGLFNPDFNPPAGEDKLEGWASGTLIIGPDGAILAQKPSSKSKTDTAEFISTYSIPLGS